MIIKIDRGHEPKICVIEIPGSEKPRVFRTQATILDYLTIQVNRLLDPPDSPPVYPAGTKPITVKEIYREGIYEHTPNDLEDIRLTYTPSYIEDKDPNNPPYVAKFFCLESEGQVTWKGVTQYLDCDGYEYIALHKGQENQHVPQHFPNFRAGLGQVAAAIVTHHNRTLTDAVLRSSQLQARKDEVQAALSDIEAMKEMSLGDRALEKPCA